MSTTVAIIMRARNEMPYVKRCFDALQKQTVHYFDLFAIDSGSTDGTFDVLRRHCRPEHLSRIAADEYVPGKVLNEAISRNTHEIIVLLNADAVPVSETWLENLITPLLNGSADATYSRQTARPDAHFIVGYDYHRAFGAAKASTEFFSAAACAFRRELWERFKFHEEGYAEDAIWATACRMFNARFLLVQDSVVEHSHNYTLRELFEKRARHGRSFARTHGKTSPLLKRFYLCLREVARDLAFACGQRQFRTIPYNIAYRVTIHAGLHRGIQEGTP
jgi:rhamnosyltransferase